MLLNRRDRNIDKTRGEHYSQKQFQIKKKGETEKEGESDEQRGEW